MFITAMIIGVGQVLLTYQFIKSIEAKCGKRAFWLFLIKFIIYAICAALLVFKFIWKFGIAFSGFLAGVPIMAIALFVYKTIYKK